MKIAVWHNLPSGGGKRALYDHVRGLVARGHTIEAWCPPTADLNYLPLGRLVPEHVLPIEWPLKPRLTDFWQITLAVQQSLAAMEAHCRLCAAEINRGGFDILFANTCRFFYATPIGRFVTIPSILYLQEPCRWLYEPMPRSRWVARPARTRSRSIVREWRSAFSDWRNIRNDRLQAREEVENAAAFTRILVNSLFSRESILRAYGLDSDVCYLGIDTDHFSDHHLPREDYVVGLGSFSPAKNINFAIEAVGAMPAPRPKLVWIGNAIFDRSYFDEVTALAMERQVEFLPHVNVSDDLLINILSRASMMIYAPRLEPFGLAPLEAGACGVPVVAVAEGGVRETIVDGVTGLIVGNDPAEASAALTRLRSDPASARRLGANARILVKDKWSFEASINRIEQSLRKYVDRVGARPISNLPLEILKAVGDVISPEKLRVGLMSRSSSKNLAPPEEVQGMVSPVSINPAPSVEGARGPQWSRVKRARAIALYLPQFHPVPENDEWWGKGFTEWTNTVKAKPMFRGHYQPHIPADLGFYDLRVPETREAQADMARRYGIEGFCYYHYWFAGRRILERPFNEVLHSGAPDFPFCLCWANATWSGIWYGEPNRILIEQTYPGRGDYEAHFRALLPAFTDPRYIRVEGKPIFLIFQPKELPDAAATLAFWRAMAVDAGLGGLHIAGMSQSRAWDPTADGFDAKVDQPVLPTRPWVSRRQPVRWARNKLEIWRGLPSIHSARVFADRQKPDAAAGDASYPCLTHAWDNTPRSGPNGVVIDGATPELFRQQLDDAIRVLQARRPERRLLFLKSWNEWAEGNHLEPDLKFSTRFLQAIGEALSATSDG